MRATNFFTVALAAAFMSSGCIKDDPVQPCPGRLTVAVDWSERTEGVPVPSVWIVGVGGYTATVRGPSHTVERPLAPGVYRVFVHNPADNITLNGSTASVAAPAGPGGRAAAVVRNDPGWFFTCEAEVGIESNVIHTLTAVMRQQVRQLTLILDPADGTPEIASIAGTLSGVAGTLDVESGTHGSPSDIALVFERIPSGPDAGKWAATVRLLGVSGASQDFRAEIAFADRTYGTMTVDSGMASPLSDFNADMTEPLALAVDMAVTPSGAGFTGTISDWRAVDGGSLTAQ